VGISLSGGLDSSSIAGVAQSMYLENPSTTSGIETLSEVFPGQACDESTYIRDMVQMWNLAHHSVSRVAPDPEPYATLTRRYLDFPGYPNGCASNPVSMLAQAKGLRVLLYGVGGDEWLWGSLRHFADLISQQRWAGIIRELSRDTYLGGLSFALSRILWYGVNPLIPHQLRRGIKWAMGKNARYAPWIDQRFADRIQLDGRIRAQRNVRKLSTFAQTHLYNSGQSGFQIHAREMEERAAAWFGFEQRHPFHDRRFVEFALSLPEEQRRQGSQGKYILRRAMRDYLPESVRQRQDKAEFSSLFVDSIEAQGGDQFFDSLAIISAGWLDGKRVREMYRQMRNPYQHNDIEQRDYLWPLWTICGVEQWYNMSILDGEAFSARGIYNPF
jgi:asparagine synthase (glutamine-hydrolysing)